MSDSGKGYSEGSKFWAYFPLLKELIDECDSVTFVYYSFHCYLVSLLAIAMGLAKAIS